MLDLIPTSWFSSISMIMSNRYLQGSDGRWIYHPVWVLIGDLPLDRRPYRFGFKPKPSKKNYCGNRDVNHVQLHGSLLMGPNLEANSDGYPGQFRRPDGRPQPFDGYVPRKNYASVTFHHMGTSTDPKRERYEYCISHVEFFMNQWFLMEVEDHVGYYLSSGSTKWNIRVKLTAYDFASRTSNTTTLGYTLDRPYFMNWSLYDESMSLSDCFQWGLKTCRQYLLAHPNNGIKQGGASAAWNFPAIDPRFGLGSSELSRLKRDFLDYALRVEPEFRDLQADLGLATQNAANSCRYFDGNTAVYVEELFELKDSILSLAKLLQGEVNLKSLADLYVSNKYGLRLTALDTIDLYDSVVRKVKERPSKQPFSVSRGSGNYSHCKLYYDPATRSGFATAMANLMEWDLFPSLTNVWDIIPYSFVVDWFADVEGFLDAYDTRTYLSVLNVFNALYSYKHEWDVNLPRSLPYFGSLSASRFVRFSKKEPIEPLPTFSGSLPNASNIVTGGALIIQRL